MTIISHKYKFIFLKSRKTAGTSVEAMLAELCGPDDILALSNDVIEECGIELRNVKIPFSNLGVLSTKSYIGRAIKNLNNIRKEAKTETNAFRPIFTQHMKLALVKEIVGDKVWNSYYKFTIERNPYDRLVSFYHWRTSYYGMNIDFNEFARIVLIGDRKDRIRYKADRFSNREFYLHKNRVAVNRVMRYEQLSDDMSKTLNEIGVDAHFNGLPFFKGGIREPKPYRDYFDNEILSLAKKEFKVEEKLFGYSF